MKLITFVISIFIFIGCAGQETPPILSRGENEEPPVTPPPAPVIKPDAEVSSQTVLTCSKEGAENVVYNVKTYETSMPCQHSRYDNVNNGGDVNNQVNCLCEVSSEHPQFQGANGIVAFANSTRQWCEEYVVNRFISGKGILVYSLRNGRTISEDLPLPHDSSYTCVRS